MADRNPDDLDFEIEFFEAVLREDPGYQEPLMALGTAYTRKGRYREGLEVDQRLVQLRPQDPIAHYNLSCSRSLLNDVDEAFESLQRAIKLGYRDFNYLLKDPDLENLRKDPRFAEVLIQHLRP